MKILAKLAWKLIIRESNKRTNLTNNCFSTTQKKKNPQQNVKSSPLQQNENPRKTCSETKNQRKQ
jgi:hypothetical protein